MATECQIDDWLDEVAANHPIEDDLDLDHLDRMFSVARQLEELLTETKAEHAQLSASFLDPA